MEIYRVYVDTSVIGGCLDEEFAPDSRRIIDAAAAGRIILLVSAVVTGELEEAPSEVRALLQQLPRAAVVDVPVTAEVLELRNAYLAAGVVGPRRVDDAGHVAAASVAGADAIVSWNFRHIVRLDKIKAYNDVNRSKGYPELTILSPKEVRFDELGEDEEGV